MTIREKERASERERERERERKRKQNKEKREMIVKITTATSILIKYQSSSRAIFTLMDYLKAYVTFTNHYVSVAKYILLNIIIYTQRLHIVRSAR